MSQALTHLPHVEEFQSGPNALLRRAIEEGYAPPPAYAKQKRAEEGTRLKKAVQHAQDARRAEEAINAEGGGVGPA